MKPTFGWYWRWLGGNYFEIYVCDYPVYRHCFKNKYNYNTLSLQEEKVLERKAVEFYEKKFGKITGTKKK